MAKPLVIVESPAKARTIARFLGSDFIVESSIGHVRDLPRSAAEVPPKYKGTEMGRLGVDVEHDFEPVYVVPKEKKQQVTKLKALLRDASELYLATDEDREGESIAWHLLEVLAPRVPVRRMVFHEITDAAIREAVEHPRELRRQLVEAQEARRILDRLYGYEVSPVLWKKVMPRLSAGRVQSVATRVLVQRERERMAFQAAAYWDLVGTFEKPGDPLSFAASLVELDGRRLATGKDFTNRGELAREGAVVLGEADARSLAGRLEGADFAVRSVDEKPYRRSPAAPFITSTLQQEAGRKLGFTAQRTMRAAQSLYENGYITYMRTDSTTLSEQALAAARSLVASRYGQEYLPPSPRRYERKVKNAQEAHEAIRPAGDSFRAPEVVDREVGQDEARVYELVFRRTVASQMADAVGRTVSIRLGATSSAGEDAEFAASGTVITFAGFRRAYEEGTDEPAAGDDQERRLPDVASGDALRALSLEAGGHETQPPSRYTEASLVKALEEMGVGRPSTYASIIGTILDRGYAWKKGSALVPSWLAFSVVGLLEGFFDELVDYQFTARMEDDLDRVANGEESAVPWLSRFYFGNGRPGLKTLVESNLGEIDAREVNSIEIGKDGEGNAVVVRVGRYGPYLQRGEDTTSVPEEIAPDELTVDRALELLSRPSGDRVLGTDPDTGLPVVARAGRFGPYVQVGDPESGERPVRTASLFKTMSLDTVTLDEALPLLSLPRVVGADPADGEEITAQNGRYGPYIKKGSDSRSIASEEQLLTISLDEALAVFAEPKRRGRGAAGAPKAPLRELGEDPASGKPMVIKDGRFGPYITDGEYNVTVPRWESVETITPERAADLLAEKRAKGPAPAKKARKATKKAAKKKA